MIVIDNTIISDEFRTALFCCELQKCSGSCCVEGDAGAPLEEEEISQLEDHFNEIKPFMSDKGIEAVKQSGVFDYDASGDYVTPLIQDRDCAFVYYEGDIVRCAIQKAYDEGRITFQKPVSCHLYPVRLYKNAGFVNVKYHQWSICDPARENGKRQGLYLYQFLRDAFIRKFGADWYFKLVQQIEGDK
jgi:hypothetical protein